MEEGKKEMTISVIEMIKTVLKDNKLIEISSEQSLAEFDKNVDGFLQLDEFFESLKIFYTHMKIPMPTKEKVFEWFKAADTNHDHKLSKDEYLPVVKKQLELLLLEMEKLLAEFTAFE